MTKFAVIRINGKQYKVKEGEDILVRKLGDTKNIKPEVLLVTEEDGKVLIGKPRLDKNEVGLKLIGDQSGEKLEIFKYKSKSRYRKHTGFRAKLTKLKVEKIS